MAKLHPLSAHAMWSRLEPKLLGKLSAEETALAREEFWLSSVGHVDMRTFVESPRYLNKQNVIWPAVMHELEQMNYQDVSEVILTGGIGVAKSTIALYTTAYQLYLLSLHDNPHAMFGLDPASEILFVMQNIKESLAKAVDYSRFRAMIEGSPYFAERFPFRSDLRDELHFPKRVIVKPVAGTDTAAIGQNVFGGIIDEVNFMAVVEKSKKSDDGGTYDQAKALYNSIARRRESRFMTLGGALPGRLCIVSSRKYPGQFTDVLEEMRLKQLKETGRTSIYLYDKRLWEIHPPGKFGDERFRVFVGDTSRKPRIMTDDEKAAPGDDALIVNVPLEYKPQFEADILNAIRDIAGRSTAAISPFLPNVSLVAACFGKTPSILTRESTDFVTSDLGFHLSRLIKPTVPRWAHVDLGLTGDSAGVAMGWVPGFTVIDRGDEGKETLPIVRFDFLLEVRPPPSDEIKFDLIRRLFYKLQAAGVNLKWISYDSFQSVDSVQILRSKGFIAGEQSMDRDMMPYDITKQAILDGRIEAPTHEKCQVEATRLERDAKTGMVDHPPNGSKDVFDALAGVTYGLSTKREIWRLHNIPLVGIPPSLLRANDNKRSVQAEENRRLTVPVRLGA